MKFGTYLALIGAASATKIIKEAFTDKATEVARSSAEFKQQNLSQSKAKHGDSSDEEKEEDHHEEKKEDHHEEEEDHHDEDKPKAPAPNETHQPELTYYKSYDHDNYSGATLREDASRMTVKITHKTEGPYCAENEFVVGYWKKYNGTDGTKMEDVKEHGDGRPVVFRVGHFQVSKCLDLAAQQMKGGEEATIHCPQDLD